MMFKMPHGVCARCGREGTVFECAESTWAHPIKECADCTDECRWCRDEDAREWQAEHR